MKKKKLITMLTALVLVGVVGVGATLAYMSSTASLTNTFEVGKVSITLDEKDYQNGALLENASRVNGNSADDYGFMYPGRTIEKDPTINVSANSEPCYLFVRVEGLDDLLEKGFTTDLFNAADLSPRMIADGWTLIENATDCDYDGLYQYDNRILKSVSEQKFPLFTQIIYDRDRNEADGFTRILDIRACAIQADGIGTIDAARAVAEDLSDFDL